MKIQMHDLRLNLQLLNHQFLKLANLELRARPLSLIKIKQKDETQKKLRMIQKLSTPFIYQFSSF